MTCYNHPKKVPVTFARFNKSHVLRSRNRKKRSPRCQLWLGRQSSAQPECSKAEIKKPPALMSMYPQSKHADEATRTKMMKVQSNPIKIGQFCEIKKATLRKNHRLFTLRNVFRPLWADPSRLEHFAAPKATSRSHRNETSGKPPEKGVDLETPKDKI